MLNRPFQKIYPLKVSSIDAEVCERETNADGVECE